MLNNVLYKGFIVCPLLFIFFFCHSYICKRSKVFTSFFHQCYSFQNWIQNLAHRLSSVSNHLVFFLGNTLESVGIWYCLENTLATSQVFPVYLPRIFKLKDLGQGDSLQDLNLLRRFHIWDWMSTIKVPILERQL